MSDVDLFADDERDAEAATLTEQALVDTRQNLGKMLDIMPIGLLIHTEQGIVFANRQACGYLQAGPMQLRGHHLLDHVAAPDVEAVAETLRLNFANPDRTCELECAVLRPDGVTRLMKIISSALPWQGNPVVQVLMQDITDQKKAEVSLRQMTITDELTGAYNRRHALYEAGLYAEGAASGGLPLSVAMIDIDHFKRVNDTFGHDAGDLVLRALTKLALEFLATNTSLDSPLFARLGGEEFLFLLPGARIEDAVAIADAFRHRVEHMVVRNFHCDLRITISGGIATYRPQDLGLEAMLKRADVALYDAKAGGRNLVRCSE